MSDFTGLAIAGRVATASDSDWDEVRLAWNLAADQRPRKSIFERPSSPSARRQRRPSGPAAGRCSTASRAATIC